MEHLPGLALSAFEIVVLLCFPLAIPMLAAAAALAIYGINRNWNSLSENRVRLFLSVIAQGLMSAIVLIYGASEYHITLRGGVSDEVIHRVIGGPLLLQLPIAAACAWWCRNAWPFSLSIGLCWGAYSLGAGFMATCAASGTWL